MRNRLTSLVTLVAVVALVACKTDRADAGAITLLYPAPEPPAPPADSMLVAIDSLRARVAPGGIAAGVDTATAHALVRLVERFAEAYPKHARAPELLMDAAGLANGTGWGNKSIQLWGYVWREQPEHPRAPEALFYQGFVFDTQYGDRQKGVEYYDRFLAHYPEHELADQASQLRQIALGAAELPPVPAAPGN